MKLVLISMAILLMTAPAIAEKKQAMADSVSGQGYGTAGCGLGSIWFGSKPGFTQVFAATTNGSSGNQTFGISSGTSNCVDGMAKHSSRVPLFIEANKVALSNDVARGNGETLANLSEVLGCSDVNHLGSTLQKNYGTLFPSADAQATNISNSLMGVVKSDARLAGDCKHVI